MLLGMADPWITAAFCANLLITLVCVIYGAVCYNSGDDSESER